MPRGCNCCHLKVIHCRTKVKLSNKVLFIELGMDIESEQLRCPETMSVDGRDWQLMGRIYSSKDWGCHFFAIVRRNDVPLKGFYIYDDLVNSGRAPYHSLNLPEQCNLSRYLFYTLQQGTAGNVNLYLIDTVCFILPQKRWIT
uniref:Uncharacterized protein n=1 Tax=Spongospora subterranea TaxID=70186 RepID=A0A0H5QYB3_9EUKA|eukprot:CRZ06712.1 hypothetical protein [Spongospora subterranea]